MRHCVRWSSAARARPRPSERNRRSRRPPTHGAWAFAPSRSAGSTRRCSIGRAASWRRPCYNHAIRNLLVTTNPAQPLRGAIARAPVEHHRHPSEKELGAFWRKPGEQGAHTTTIAATKLLPTMTRRSELLRSKWPEFDLDLDAAQWDIPAERMKMGKAHRVFLSRQAVEILRQVQELTGQGEYVFPSIFRGSVPMRDVTLNHFFERIDFGVPDFSPHGTRGTAATRLREHGFGRDVAELLLAHSEKNAAVASNSHMELAADRKRAPSYLADRVEALAAGTKVIPLRSVSRRAQSSRRRSPVQPARSSLSSRASARLGLPRAARVSKRTRAS